MSRENTSGGVGLFGLMFLVFLVLKLCGVIDWSWLWVTAPLWGGIVGFFVVIIVGIVFSAILAGILGILSWFSN